MNKNRALKLTLGCLSAAVLLSVPTTIARADSFTLAEQGVAGISVVMDDKTDQQIKEAYEASLPKKESPYANLGVSTADVYVNVRKSPSTESEVVGKLYKGCAADILETLDGGWVRIKSGKVEGYIASQFLAIGEQAEKMVDEYATVYAIVKPTTLNVRQKASIDSPKLSMVPKGEKYIVVKQNDEWAEILFNTDDSTGEEETGYVNKEYVDIDVQFKFAVSIEEEKQILEQQQKAEQAEKERKEQLAKDNDKKNHTKNNNSKNNDKNHTKNDDKNTNNNDNKNDNKGGTKTEDKPSGNTSAKGSEIASYALKFVGNPYVWGGTSLTNGADCSGFVQSIYEDFGYSLPRTSRDQAASAGRVVSESSMQPGDLIFYANSRGVVGHVAMYIGNGKIVHAASKRQGIIVSKYNYHDVYRVRRIVD